EGFEGGGPAVGLHDGEHADAGFGVVVAVEPRDGHEVRELPDEEDGEEGDSLPFDDAAGSGPAEERGQGSGEGSDEGGQRGDALERGVDPDVEESGEQGEAAGDQIGFEREP